MTTCSMWLADAGDDGAFCGQRAIAGRRTRHPRCAEHVPGAPTLAELEARYAARYAATPLASWDSFEQNATEQGLAYGSYGWYREILAEADGEGVA